jgi:TonB family protein
MKSLALAFTVAASTIAFTDGADPLTVAKELYASAAYEEALTTLTEARKAEPSSKEAIQLDQYRVFCLYALGRRGDAESVAQGIVRADPFFQPSEEEASPAINALFAAVKRQTLPTVIKDRYRSAKAALDKKDAAAAEPLLEDVQHLIAQWSAMGQPDEAISDIGVLAEGFLTLARSKTPDPTDARAAAAPAARTDNATIDSSAPAMKANDANTVFGPESTGVTPPVAIVQSLPPVPLQFVRNGERRGIYEVTIEPTGRVATVVVRQSMNPAYDRLAIDAAKKWQFKPAMKDGQPVKFMKAVAVELKTP